VQEHNINSLLLKESKLKIGQILLCINYCENKVSVVLGGRAGAGATLSHTNNVVTPTKVKVELDCDNYKVSPEGRHKGW
jgi:hypothetical protein